MARTGLFDYLEVFYNTPWRIRDRMGLMQMMQQLLPTFLRR